MQSSYSAPSILLLKNTIVGLNIFEKSWHFFHTSCKKNPLLLVNTPDGAQRARVYFVLLKKYRNAAAVLFLI
jgi:hypothetical protein